MTIKYYKPKDITCGESEVTKFCGFKVEEYSMHILDASLPISTELVYVDNECYQIMDVVSEYRHDTIHLFVTPEVDPKKKFL